MNHCSAGIAGRHKEQPLCPSRTLRSFATAIFLCALLSGCSALQAGEEQINFELGSQPVLYRDQWARRNPPQVHVRPKDLAGAEPTALFVPFRVTQPVSDPEIIGYTQARVVWQTWLSMQLFPAMEFDATAGPFRRDKALALARAKGADIVIGGFVTYYYAAGTASDSQVAIQVEIYDTATGQMIWSMAQSALMPAGLTNDYLLFAVKTRLPSDPMYVLAKTMAQDMGLIIRDWMIPPDPKTRLQQTDDRLRRAWRGDDASNPPRPPARKEESSF